MAHGYVIESKVDKNSGVVATLLVGKGTIRIGDVLVAGHSFGRVRAMVSDQGKELTEATPSMPVEVIGLESTPEAGDEFDVVRSEKQARDISEFRLRRERNLRTARVQKTSLEELFEKASASGKHKELPLIIRGDVHGSVEAITASLEKLASSEVKVNVLHAAAGAITESDVALADASRGVVVGFNVRANVNAKELASKLGVDIRYYSIIYDLIDDMKAILGGLHAPKLREQYLGTAEIRQVFEMSKLGKVAGCFILDGIVKRGAKVRLLRDEVVIHEGTLKTLRRFKDDVKEVRSNFECGMAFENYEGVRPGDKIEAFEVIEEKVVL